MSFERLHRKRNPFRLCVRAEDFHFDDLAGFHHFSGLLDEAAREFAEMHQAILMDADIDKRAKGCDIGDHTG